MANGEFEEADFAGRHVKRVDNKILMNQKKYILEKLEAIKVPRGQKSDKIRLLNEEEFEIFRSMLYKVHWVAHQARPEDSGIVSISRLKAASNPFGVREQAHHLPQKHCSAKPCTTSF